jgi:hypothetical protein
MFGHDATIGGSVDTVMTNYATFCIPWNVVQQHSTQLNKHRSGQGLISSLKVVVSPKADKAADLNVTDLSIDRYRTALPGGLGDRVGICRTVRIRRGDTRSTRRPAVGLRCAYARRAVPGQVAGEVS